MRRSTRRALVSVFLGFWIGLGLLHAKNGRTIPVRVSENAGDHFTYYAIGQDGRIRIDNPKLTEKLQALGNVATGTKIVFLIDDEVPLAEMNVISMLVDKYDLAVECPAFFEPVSMRETVFQGANDGPTEEAYCGAGG